MTDTITLTREQWDGIFGALSEIREAADDLAVLADAFEVVGQKPMAFKLETVSDWMANETIAAQTILIQADDAQVVDAKRDQSFDDQTDRP